MKEAGRCDDPNAIHRWNIFKSEVIEKPNYYKNYFSLTEEKRELLETVLDVTFKIKDFCTEKYQMSIYTKFCSLYNKHGLPGSTY